MASEHQRPIAQVERRIVRRAQHSERVARLERGTDAAADRLGAVGAHHAKPEEVRRLRTIAGLADRNPWRRQFRQAMIDNNEETLLRLAGEVKLAELPAGSINPGESAEAAAARECEEEIGLAPALIERVRGLFSAPGFCDEELIFFRVSNLHPPAPDSPHHPDDDEDIHAQPFAITEAKAMVTRGEIVDLKTAYGLSLL